MQPERGVTSVALGRYQLLESIGIGGMAEIFRARLVGVAGFERLVAVKCLHSSLVADEQFRAMFIDEAKIAVQLNHVNIVRVLELANDGGRYYIALEHVHGRDLKRVFNRCNEHGVRMPIAHAVHVVTRLLRGLDYAHDYCSPAGEPLQLVHRDVSLQNVVLSFEGEVKLIDFGIAKATGRLATTRDGFIKGKFAYMSPEQMRGLPVDRRSDIFSVGTVLWELLSGKRLFHSASTLETIGRVRAAEIPSLQSIVPERLEAIVRKALARHPSDRYQTAAALGADLAEFARESGELVSRRALANWLRDLFPGEQQAEASRLAELCRRAAAGDGPPVERRAVSG